MVGDLTYVKLFTFPGWPLTFDLCGVMADGSILGIIQRKNPEKEFDIAKQIGSGTYGEVYEVIWEISTFPIVKST